MAMQVAPVAGGELAYETAGTENVDQDAVVFLHGGLLDRHQWDVEFADVATTHAAVRFDARGHGESSPARDEFGHHTDLIALLDHLALSRVTGVGLSLGARTLIDAALLHPERFGALLLVSPGYSGMDFEDPFILGQHTAMAEAALRRDGAGIIEGFLRAWVDGPARSPSDVDPAMRARCQAMALLAIQKLTRAGNALEVGARDRFAELTMPVGVVLGELDSTDIVAACGRIVGNAPDARLHTITNAGHALNLDRPDEFAVVLRDFLTTRAAAARRSP
jgi:3-oxoadipate enol-lactonase